MSGSKLLLCLLVIGARTDGDAPAMRELGFITKRSLPAVGSPERARIEVGKQLFFDTRLSGNGKMSCASCHYMTVDDAGATKNPRDAKVDGSLAPNNSPSVFNASFSFRQRWRGDGGDLEEVIDIPLVNLMHERGKTPDEIWASVEAKTGHSRAVIRKSLADYMRALQPYGSKLDEERGMFEKGSLAEKGYTKFRDYGCVSCHQGVGVGGNMVAPLGAMVREGEKRDFNDYGLIRFEGGKPERYRVPSLRNVARTWPYFHNGAVTDLGDAVRFMGHAQLGRKLSDDDVHAIVAFLETLNGAPHAELLR